MSWLFPTVRFTRDDQVDAPVAAAPPLGAQEEVGRHELGVVDPGPVPARVVRLVRVDLDVRRRDAFAGGSLEHAEADVHQRVIRRPQLVLRHGHAGRGARADRSDSVRRLDGCASRVRGRSRRCQRESGGLREEAVEPERIRVLLVRFVLNRSREALGEKKIGMVKDRAYFFYS